MQWLQIFILLVLRSLDAKADDHKDNMNDDHDSINQQCIEVIKKAMAADKLAELAVIDPKRAKRWFFHLLKFPCKALV